MFTASRAMFRRIGPWPRRIAALACVLLAALTAVSSHPSASSGASTSLRAHQVAVPVTAAVTTAVSPGQHIGFLAAPGDGSAVSASGDLPPPGSAELVADGLRVLAVHGSSGALTGSDATVVTVAASRDQAVRLARYASRTLVLISDDLP